MHSTSVNLFSQYWDLSSPSSSVGEDQCNLDLANFIRQSGDYEVLFCQAMQAFAEGTHGQRPYQIFAVLAKLGNISATI